MIVVFGSINADLVARVDALPRAGETQLATGYAVHAGGKGANQALAARRAGAQVSLRGAVGRDSFATIALATLRDAGVDVERVETTDDATGLALIHVDPQGRNTITVVAGANRSVRACALEDRDLRNASTLMLQFELPLSEVIAVAQRAHACGARVILNASPSAPLAEALLGAVGVLVVNEHEATVVARAAGLPEGTEAFCGAAADRWNLTAIVTLGAEGVVAADASQVVRVPAAPVAVADTTAAGDAFVGALAAALERRATLVEALADGAAAGSHACGIAGAQPSIAGRDLWSESARTLAAAARVARR
ncbi:MAG: ribokinase [Betaproteobacteria bacterium]